MDDFVTEFNEKMAAKSREVCERIEREDAERRGGLSERERAILDMWPRFEDGEYVWFGDAVEAHHGGAIIVEAIEFTRGAVCVKDAKDGDWDTSMYAMHPLKRPVPKVLDADGVEIKVGDTVWTLDGLEGVVTKVEDGAACIACESDYAQREEADNLTHARPESWERLEEDACKGVCEYAGAYRKSGTIDSHECDGCRFDSDGNGPTCEQQMALDIICRAKALAGEEVE